MSRPSRSAQIDDALLGAVVAHPRDLVAYVSAQLGISKSAVSARVRRLVADDYLTRQGSTRSIYGLGGNRRAVFVFDRAGLEEDRVWTRHVSPLISDLPRNVIDIVHYGLTEMVNNAIDHSQGENVIVLVERDRKALTLSVFDDGVGIFDKIAKALDLPDKRLALLELSKGKFTTDPERHSGEGIFFTSKMFDGFEIVSGDLHFDHTDGEEDFLVEADERMPAASGTAVRMRIAIDSRRDSAKVFAMYSSGPDEYSFAKTVVPVRLAKVGEDNLISRSQAKRLLLRVERFRHVILDFEGVERIGQAFADEIFRVFANAHPETELVAMNAIPEVQQMIRRAEVLRNENANRTH